MFRLLAKVLLIVLPTSLLADGTARDAQGMLSRLGYQISVDGNWGPQSQRVISQFYTDRGLTYDGTLSENEFEDLSAAIADLPVYVHPRSPYVDYSRTYNFPAGDWERVDIDAYRARYTQVYGRPQLTRSRDSNHMYWSETCDREFHNYDLLKRINLGDNDIYHHSQTQALSDCLKALPQAIHDAVVVHGRNSAPLELFFGELIPAWIKNDAFNASGMRSTQVDNTSAGYAFAVDFIAEIYTSYGHYWGTTPEMDRGFREWWDARSHDDGAKIYGPGWEKCVEFTEAGRFPQKTDTGECNNVAADYATALAYMGMYYKDSDLINEALFVAGAVARSSSPEGAVIDSWRFGHAIGYMTMTADRLDETALVLQDLGINLYDSSFAKHGATVRDIIEFTAREYVNPDRVYAYACNHPMQTSGRAKQLGFDCKNQDYSVPPEDRVWQDSMHIRGMAGALYQYPQYRDMMSIVNPGNHANGWVTFDTMFNKYILMRDFGG
jgi:hypothetical protein